MDTTIHVEQKRASLLISIYLLIYMCLIFAILLFGCSVPNPKNQKKIKDNLYSIDVESTIEKGCDIPISEVAKEIKYIPLETRPDNLLSSISQIEITESYIFVSERNKLLLFSQDGKIVRQIGNFGRGPGEYSNIMHFAVNEKANIVLVQDEYRCNKYDMTGNFKGEVNSLSIQFMFFSPTRIVFYLINHVEKPINLVITDTDLIPLFKFQNHNPRPKTNTKFSIPPLYVFENKLYFKEHFNDTVFCVKDSLFIPHIIYNEKKLLFDKDFDLHATGNISDLKNQLEKVKDKLMTNNIFESKRFVFTSYLRGLGPLSKNDTGVLFDKIKNNTYVINGGKFINDIDGGFELWPMGVCKDSFMINYQTAFEIKAYVSSNIFKSSTPKYPEKKKELEQLANSLDENDNPVLMLVKLKE